MPEIIEGMADFEARLKELDLTMQQKSLIKAAEAGADIVQQDAAARAPRKTGRLASRIIKVVSRKESDVYEATVNVGPSRGAFWGSFVERGTVHMGKEPFLGPALEFNRERIVAAMKEALAKAISKFEGKIARRNRG